MSEISYIELLRMAHEQLDSQSAMIKLLEQTLKDTAIIWGEKIAELEKERDVYASAFHQLKGEFLRCDNCGYQSECKDFDIFNGGTVDWLQAIRDLEQQSKGLGDWLDNEKIISMCSEAYNKHSFQHGIHMTMLNAHEKSKQLSNQAKALKEDNQ
jgi:hypothetical protein